jgi:outer membrane immunogenic protein
MRRRYAGQGADGRAYAAMDNLLVYATGGLALGASDYGANIRRSAFLLNYTVPASTTTTKFGWTVGGGFEYALPKNWSIKAEYLYYDLGSASITGNLIIAGIVTAPQATYTFATRGSIVRLGLNYKLN